MPNQETPTEISDFGISFPAKILKQAETTGKLPDEIYSRLKFDSAGLICAVVQDWQSKLVLMVAWMDAEALRRTLISGRVTYWSRSRQEYWLKGETSGHFQYLKSIQLDCDGDALLLGIEQVGAACHTGTTSCFEAGGDLPANLN